MVVLGYLRNTISIAGVSLIKVQNPASSQLTLSFNISTIIWVTLRLVSVRVCYCCRLQVIDQNKQNGLVVFPTLRL